jgi:hypothetical protein
MKISIFMERTVALPHRPTAVRASGNKRLRNNPRIVLAIQSGIRATYGVVVPVSRFFNTLVDDESGADALAGPA